MSVPTVEVKKWQIWKDNDKRMGDNFERYLLVVTLFQDSQLRWKASCLRCSKDGEVLPGQAATAILVKRMRPTSTGYVFVGDK